MSTTTSEDHPSDAPAWIGVHMHMKKTFRSAHAPGCIIAGPSSHPRKQSIEIKEEDDLMSVASTIGSPESVATAKHIPAPTPPSISSASLQNVIRAATLETRELSTPLPPLSIIVPSVEDTPPENVHNDDDVPIVVVTSDLPSAFSRCSRPAVVLKTLAIVLVLLALNAIFVIQAEHMIRRDIQDHHNYHYHNLNSGDGGDVLTEHKHGNDPFLTDNSAVVSLLIFVVASTSIAIFILFDSVTGFQALRRFVGTFPVVLQEVVFKCVRVAGDVQHSD